MPHFEATPGDACITRRSDAAPQPPQQRVSCRGGIQVAINAPGRHDHAGKIVTSICENDGFRLAPFSGGFWAHLAILDRVVQGLAPLRQPIHARPLVAVATPAGPEPGNYHAG